MIYYVILLFGVFLIILRFKKSKSKLKKCIHCKLSKVKGIFYTQKLCLNCLEYKNYDNTLNQIKLIDNIISCAKYGAPKLYNENIDFLALKNFGIDITIPILYFKKFDSETYNAVKIAKTYYKFNAITDIRFSNSSYHDILYLDSEFSIMSLYCSIMALNVYAEDKFKVIKNDDDKLTTKVNNQAITYTYIENNNYQTYQFSNSETHIQINQFNFDGEYKKISTQNKSSKTISIDLEFIYDLNTRNLYFENTKRQCKIVDVVTKQFKFLLCDKNIEINYQGSQYLNPRLQIIKHIYLKGMQNSSFNLYFGNTIIDKNYLENSSIYYKNKIKEMTNIKIKSSNIKLNYLFNYYLKQHITTVNYLQIDATDIDVVYSLYKNKKINAIDFYMWLKEKYLGIKIFKDKLKIVPIFKENFEFELIINNKKICVAIYSGEEQKCINIDGIKYCNINIIPFSQISNCNNLIVYV